MASLRICSLILCLTIFFDTCYSSKMLLVMSGGSKSHAIFYNGVIDALASRGHQITFITPFKSSKPRTNVREVIVSENYMEILLTNSFEADTVGLAQSFFDVTPKGCVKTFVEDAVQQVLLEDYDLIMIPFYFSDCYLPYIHSKKVPFLYINPNTLTEHYWKVVGDIDFPSFVPNLMLEHTYPMTFYERLTSTMVSLVILYLNLYVVNHNTEVECRKRELLSADTPSITDLQAMSSLAVINSVRTLESPQRPHSPTVVFAGGIHIRPKGVLWKDLQNWLDDSGDEGFILFSLGSQVKPSQMKEEHRLILLNTFKSLKQRVLWKWDQTEMENLPPNVKLSQWVPQQDVLAHPKIKLFITHGGLLSILEATNFGVPMLGLSVFGDQHHNMAQVEAEGWGRKIHWDNLTGEELQNTINQIIYDSSIRETAIQRSRIMKDRPQSPSEEVVYWIEYVLRHGGAKHLQTPIVHMPWYQLYNTDVWIFLAMTALFALISVFFIFWILYRCCCRCGTIIMKRKFKKD